VPDNTLAVVVPAGYRDVPSPRSPFPPSARALQARYERP
jgi:hypothetical protein